MPQHMYCSSNSSNVKIYQQEEREQLIMDIGRARKEITPYTQKPLQKCFTSFRYTEETHITLSPSELNIPLLSEMKLLEAPTIAS